MQILVNGIVSGLAYGLIAIGFSIIYAGCRFLHVAHAAIYAIGAYTFYFFAHQAGLNMAVSFVLAICCSALAGVITELLVYRPLRQKDATPLVLLVASLGLFFLMQNSLSLYFGDGTKVLRMGPVQEGFIFLGARLTAAQISIVVISLVLCLIIWPYLRFTKAGRLYRAISSSQELAIISGIRVDRILLISFIIGSILAGLAGILIGYDLDATPRMGFNMLLIGIVAVIIGGIGSIPGAMVGGLLIGLIQHATVSLLSSRWEGAITFIVLLFFLLVRPHGLLGKATDKWGL